MAQLISLDMLAPQDAQGMRSALSGESGCSSSSCGSSDGPSDLPPEIWEKVKDHPCYSEEAHHYFARMHVAVRPRVISSVITVTANMTARMKAAPASYRKS